MLHTAFPPGYAWPAMSHPGPELLHSPGVLPDHGGVIKNGGHPGDIPGQEFHSPGQLEAAPIGHQAREDTNRGQISTPLPSFNTGYQNHVTINNYNNFPSYTIHHTASHHRPASRLPHEEGWKEEASQQQHRGSQRGTPPSPGYGSNPVCYKAEPPPNVKIPEGASRDKLELLQLLHYQKQCNSTAPPRMQPPSPISHMPQKSPFDMSKTGLSKSQEQITAERTAAQSPVLASSRVHYATKSHPEPGSSRMPASPYQSNIKQEPGSPAQYAAANVANRAVKQEPNHPNSPQNVNATPPPPPQHNQYPNNNPMERRMVAGGGCLQRVPGYNYPSPQSHHTGSNPISPAAANIGETNPRPMNKFRYPSGPQPVQNLSPGESTSNSAMSSREGTPGPRTMSWCGESDSTVPNIDITQVRVKEEAGAQRNIPPPYGVPCGVGDDYSHRPSVNISYPATTTTAQTPGAPTYPTNDRGGSGMYGYHHSIPQQVVVPPRYVQGMRVGAGRGQPSHQHSHASLLGQNGPGITRNLLPGNSESHISHSNVKIGRRPAHLPKVLMFNDKTLPPGWVRKLKQRKHGKQAGRWDVYIYSPCGVKFASRKKLKSFFEKNNLNYDPEDFDFTPYGRHIDQSGHGGHNRHRSSSSNEGRHGNSPSSMHSSSPTSSYLLNRPPDAHSEFITPPTPHTPHRSHSYPQDLSHHHQQQGGFDHQPFNPMMESPPNANALQVPQHSILNLSQPNNHQLNSMNQRVPSHPPFPNTSTQFPSDMANILSEPEAQRMRQYQIDLTARQGHNLQIMDTDQHNNSPGERTPGPAEEEEARGERNEETKFMSHTYSLLTASQGDLGDMMEDYIYSE